MISAQSKTLINNACCLDNLTQSGGVIYECAINIVQNNDENSARKMCAIIGKLADGEYSKDVVSQAKELKESLVEYYGHLELSKICDSQHLNGGQKEESIEELLEDLNNLIGLDEVKSRVKDLIAYQKIQSLRKGNGLSTPKNTLHLAFMGNPGTGKTTVARIVGRIYKQLGLLSKGHFIEASRTDLIAGYQGQTALKVKAVIERAKGGVLFIDEAYSITENDHSDSYGRECLTELTKALEDYREDLVVIVAGYTEPMRKFFDSNPGLRSRFNTFIEFEDYSVGELLEILGGMCAKDDYELDEGSKLVVEMGICNTLTKKEEQFSNGRFVRNLFEDMVMNHARRVYSLTAPTVEDLKVFIADDIPTYLNANNV